MSPDLHLENVGFPDVGAAQDENVDASKVEHFADAFVVSFPEHTVLTVTVPDVVGVCHVYTKRIFPFVPLTRLVTENSVV